MYYIALEAVMRIERELLKGVIPLAVLSLLKRRPMYGYELATEISDRSGNILMLGRSTLYPLLHNLEARQFVESMWRSATNGRKRKYYQLTDKGHKRLEQDLRQWNDLACGMRQLIGESETA